MLVTLAQVVFLLTAIMLSVIIILQQSKGGMGAAMGGASSTVFGAKGAGSFLYKSTRGLAMVFFISALVLGYAQNQAASKNQGILQNASFEAGNSQIAIDVPVNAMDNARPASNADIPVAAPVGENDKR